MQLKVRWWSSMTADGAQCQVMELKVKRCSKILKILTNWKSFHHIWKHLISTIVHSTLKFCMWLLMPLRLIGQIYTYLTMKTLPKMIQIRHFIFGNIIQLEKFDILILPLKLNWKSFDYYCLYGLMENYIFKNGK